MLNQNKQKARSQGFTLVELSIVIIIIGFLIAGIAAGTSLINQARLNSVITDMQNYQTAYNTFLQRYSGAPGDLKNASSYFSNCAEVNSECDGNGNGLITGHQFSPGEIHKAWRQLALSNIISAGIAQIPDGGWGGVETLGSTVPTSRVSGAGYVMMGDGQFGESTWNAYSPFNNNTINSADGSTNAIFIAKVTDVWGLGFSVFKTEDAFNLDKKIDDGNVSGGDFIGGATGNFRTFTGVELNDDETCVSGGIYDLTVTDLACVSGLALN